MSTMPMRSQEQRSDALRLANSRRKRRAYRKAIWRHAPLQEAVADFRDLLESPPEWALSWKVWDALLALPKVGMVKAMKVMRVVGMSHVKTLGGLSPRQRHELGQYLSAPVVRKRMPYKPRAKVPCECGAPKTAGSRRCLACLRSARAAAVAPKLVCPECGGRKDPKSVACLACWEANPRNPFKGRRVERSE